MSKRSSTDDMPLKLLSRKWSDDSDDQPDDHGDGLSPRALKILEDMKADGIEPDGFCYSSAISCCGAEGRWKEALLLIDTMKKGGPRTRPNRIAYTAAISACGRAGQADYALKLFKLMKDEGLSADRVAYNALFSALRVAGDADKTFQLWGEICGTRSTVSTTAIATAKDIAKMAGLQPEATYRFLRYLTTLANGQFCVEGNDYNFQLGPVGQVLTPHHPKSVANAILWEASETPTMTWLHLTHFLSKTILHDYWFIFLFLFCFALFCFVLFCFVFFALCTLNFY